MHRLLSVPILLATLSGTLLLGGCGDDAGEDQAGDESSSSTSTTPAATPSNTASGTASGTASESVSPTESSSPVAPSLPSCASVWQDGHKLALGYRGCLDGDQTVTAQKQPCEFGKPLVTFRNRFWAAAGGPVHEASSILAKDAGWHRALVQCGG